MLVLIVLLVFIGSLRTDRGPISDLSDETFELLINGGHKPDSHRWSRHVVSIRTLNYVEAHGDNHFCSGTLIGSRAVLTAAHCLTDRYKASMNPRGLRVVFCHVGRLENFSKEQSRRVDKIVIHPKYERYKRNDVAIIRLIKRVPTENHDVVPILLRKKANISIGAECVTMGWGQIYQHGPYSDELLYMDVIVSAHSLCKKHVANYNQEENICVAPDLEGEYCAGDTGGPLICRGALAGIIGGALGCAGGKAMKFVSFPKFKTWIEDTVRELTSQASSKVNSIYFWAFAGPVLWILR